MVFVCLVSMCRYFNIPLPYQWASEFCEMVTPCGNGPAAMGALASIASPAENMEVYRLVASFSQDNQMEREVWIGWNSQNPYTWEDGTPAFPHGFAAFVSGGHPGGGGWPVDPRMPFGEPPGFAPVMRREFDTIPGRRLPNGRMMPPIEGPSWYTSELTGHQHAFVCEVPAGQTNLLDPTPPPFAPITNAPPINPRPNAPTNPRQPNAPTNPRQPNAPTNPRQPNAPTNPRQPRLYQ